MSYLGQIPRPYEITRDSDHWRHVDNMNDNWSEAWDPPAHGWLLFTPDCDVSAHSVHLPKEAFTWDAIPCPKCGRKRIQ